MNSKLWWASLVLVTVAGFIAVSRTPVPVPAAPTWQDVIKVEPLVDGYRMRYDPERCVASGHGADEGDTAVCDVPGPDVPVAFLVRGLPMFTISGSGGRRVELWVDAGCSKLTTKTGPATRAGNSYRCTW